MGELFLPSFVTLFVVIAPIGCAPIFGGLTRGAGQREASAIALLATPIATIILLTFALCGALMLAALTAARPIVRLLGTRVEAVMTRVLGVLLSAPAGQYVIDGVKGVLLLGH